MSKDNESSNPVLSKINFEKSSDSMTAMGTVIKTLLLLILLFVAAVYSYSESLKPGLLIASALGGFVVGLVVIFNPKISPLLGPVYAIAEGIVLGQISRIADIKHPGVAIEAVFGTLGVFLVMLFLYRKKIITVNEKYIGRVVACMVGLLMIYLANLILMAFGINMPVVNDSSVMGIIFSCAVVILAAFNLGIDFEMINKGVEERAPKHMEWYLAFGLIVSICWLYMEVLRLLQKVKGDK